MDYPALASRPLAGAARICHPGLLRPEATLDSPAIEVMTDLRKVTPVTTEPTATMEHAHDYMMKRGVRMLLALNPDGTLAGIVTANDILGEKPVAVVREQRIRHAEILVSDIMTPAAKLDAFDMSRIEHALVGHIVTSLQQSRRNHALVVQQDSAGRPEVRGIYSLSQIARQLGVPLDLPAAAGSFSEIEAALVG
jgi:CBS-domain-containing membrane protein